MMKKKWISFLLCLTVVAGTLAGCGNKQEQEEAKSEKEASKETEGKDTKEGSVSGELNSVC